MSRIGDKTKYLIIILLLFVSSGCAKYDEYSSKCGNQPETVLKALDKAYADGKYEQAQQYLTKADSTYYSDLKNELGDEYFHQSMQITSFLAQNTTWTVEKKNINKDGTAQLSLLLTGPDIAEKGKIVLGGCVIEPGAPDWFCGSCKYEWSDSKSLEEN